MDVVQKLKQLIGIYDPVKKVDISKNYPNHEMRDFMKIISDINWSRGYGWFVELEGAPFPFHYNGGLGLPATDVTFTTVEGAEYEWNSSSWRHYVPKTRAGQEEINIDLIDDENATLYTFFEDWMNEIYDPFKGVLPLSEACKKITIHRFTSERYRVKRKVNSSEVEGYTFYVYPFNNITETLGDTSDPVKLNVKLRIAGHANLGTENVIKEVYGSIVGMG